MLREEINDQSANEGLFWQDNKITESLLVYYCKFLIMGSNITLSNKNFPIP